MVLLCGEPGIGKSRLVVALQEGWPASPTPAAYYCSPHYRDSAFHVIASSSAPPRSIATTTLPRSSTSSQALCAVRDDRPSMLPLLAELLSIPPASGTPPCRSTPQRSASKTLAALIDAARGLAARAPALIVFEDLHWIDPTSRELLEHLVDRVQLLPALVVIT